MKAEAPLFDATALRDEFRHSNMSASRRALWCAGHPGAEPDTCRYCGRHWRHRAGSKLDGHAACIVTEDFKHHVGAILRSSPRVTYAAIAEALGVTQGIVTSWAHSAGVSGPVEHALRRGGKKA